MSEKAPFETRETSGSGGIKKPVMLVLEAAAVVTGAPACSLNKATTPPVVTEAPDVNGNQTTGSQTENQSQSTSGDLPAETQNPADVSAQEDTPVPPIAETQSSEVDPLPWYQEGIVFPVGAGAFSQTELQIISDGGSVDGVSVSQADAKIYLDNIQHLNDLISQQTETKPRGEGYVHIYEDHTNSAFLYDQASNSISWLSDPSGLSMDPYNQQFLWETSGPFNYMSIPLPDGSSIDDVSFGKVNGIPVVMVDVGGERVTFDPTLRDWVPAAPQEQTLSSEEMAQQRADAAEEAATNLANLETWPADLKDIYNRAETATIEDLALIDQYIENGQAEVVKNLTTDQIISGDFVESETTTGPHVKPIMEKYNGESITKEMISAMSPEDFQAFLDSLTPEQNFWLYLQYNKDVLKQDVIISPSQIRDILVSNADNNVQYYSRTTPYEQAPWLITGTAPNFGLAEFGRWTWDTDGTFMALSGDLLVYGVETTITGSPDFLQGIDWGTFRLPGVSWGKGKVVYQIDKYGRQSLIGVIKITESVTLTVSSCEAEIGEHVHFSPNDATKEFAPSEYSTDLNSRLGQPIGVNTIKDAGLEGYLYEGMMISK